ncbi:MAG: ribonucleoside-diphosphate reductase subunit alpha [Candidatus Magasanikbacteria bacterium CG11_big_fil_rev_8_21_14_0_20_39_34]|uniref:Ribonucleoside-diphosphate reductase n=1 Tax=Candidatus Magasanikbacteria bacterium CG11_big_fil_rev_8_21_14_0_20_39_34 TaxID=1974653 RepID=A0A2H0N6C7_9BACT|nr:MAG: ribonucleoside-diphosphate reductase subunit alpha [Candidatus Magasanikbacteria bacterium CG11_big_fil_rev_8_21_14_0_20_39_34]
MTSTIAKVKKRNGDIVPFDPMKITRATAKAFQVVHGSVDEKMLEKIAKDVLADLEKSFSDEKVPSVEDVQNTVEKILMGEGFFNVAKAYIIYRYEHSKVRQEKKQEAIKKAEEGQLYITKKNGRKELFSMEKLKKYIGHIIEGQEHIIDVDAVADQLRLEIYEGIDTDGIERALIMVLRSWIELDPAYSYAAAKALNTRTYKEVIGADIVNFERLDAQLRESFIKNIKKAIGIGRLDPRLLMFDLEDLAAQLDFSLDDTHNYLSTQTLTDRYFNTNPYTKEILETIQSFWMRVAMGLAINEENRQEKAKEFYHIMSKRLYVPSTPTLFHSGTTHPQMSSCYLTTIEDSLDHIFKCISDNAQLSKWSGGIGNDWTNLRACGALIKGTGVESQGIVPFMKIANDTTVAINRSGRRRGATCAYLEVWHYDIEDFLELRKNTGDERRRTHDMNTCNWIPDLFMKRVRDNGDWALFSPNEVEDLHHTYGKEFERRYAEYEKKGARGELKMYKKMKAVDLWKKMINMLFETGHPWITWKDPSNIRSPQDHVGVVHNSNLCTEITLNTSPDETAVCNLGSINLEAHVGEQGLDVKMVENTVRIAMRMLDNVIDLNFYPTPEAKNSNFRHRPVGLGIMGFQNALYKMGINFDSERAVEFGDYSMEVVSYYAILCSSELAKERGTYGTFKGSKWDRGIFPVDTLDVLEKERGEKIDVSREGRLDWTPVREHVATWGMRNSNTMACAPTATISNITGTTPTIEPIYKNIYVKANQAGDFTIVNPYLVDELKKHNLWDNEMLSKLKYHDGSIQAINEIPQQIKDTYKEVFEIDMTWLAKIAAYRGKWIDQSQSLNIFFSGTSGRELSNLYLYAWSLGLKTTYYLRTLSASQVEKSTVQTTQFGSTHIRSQSEATLTTATAQSTVAQPVTVQVQEENKPVATVGAMVNKNIKQQNEEKMVGVDPESGVKLCKIADPDCEACQ